MVSNSGLHATYLGPILEHHGHAAANLLQILREAQEHYGYIHPDAVDYLGAELHIPRSRIEGVATFYSFLHLQPHGEYCVLFSDNITDRMLGSTVLTQQMCQQMWVEPGKVSEDGLLSVNTTSCTGMCDQGPAMLVNGRAITRLTQQRVQEIGLLIRNRTPLSDWPADFFRVDDNIRRKGLLLDSTLVSGEVLRAAQAMGAPNIVEVIKQSGLRGRGGAGFPTGLKWESCRNAQGTKHYVVCNADEGEPGTFKDRVLLTCCSDLLFEGMTLCALAVGATQGYLYLRGEYRYLLEPLQAVLQRRRNTNLLGKNILGKRGFDFDIAIHLGAGAYICGEESALIESLEGKRGVPRNRPPFPVTHGYLQQPTAV
ncbi:MAG TPA: NAD(P)H-dependent oxidoreductase subunit E, partial [Gallionella sp.]|nr:NAD(P)H-dependent oxidoreductase subunit E [Gallionella sp.]